MKSIIFLFCFISIMHCIRENDLCIPNDEKFEIECYGIYSYNCANLVCTKNQYGCHVLSLFSGLKGIHKLRYDSFMDSIKPCSKIQSSSTIINNWNADDVCLNTKDCSHKTSIHRILSNKIKRNECKCIGKYSYRCNGDYCGLDKQACDGLSKNTVEIKKCDYSKIKLILYNNDF